MGEQIKYRVWHIPQVPMKPFEHFTNNLGEAKIICKVLAQYDLFQYEHNVKGDYSNAQGICEWNEEAQEYWDIEENH